MNYYLPQVENLSLSAESLLAPISPVPAHQHRLQRLQQIYGTPLDGASPYFDVDQIKDTFDGTQLSGEHHRRLTPFLQEIFRSNRKVLLSNLDFAANQSKLDESVYDVVIIGSGPHGAAVAAGLRAKNTALSVAIIDQGLIGGQFRSYGPKPAFMMNSRVRRADRRLPAQPRTNGSINPLGSFATLELSDVVMGNYAMNTDLGDICAVNAYLAASEVISRCRVIGVEDGRVLYENLDSGKFYRVRGRVIVDATGVGMKSALTPQSEMREIWKAKKDSRYFDAAAFYSYFAHSKSPLERFHNKNVAVIGAGDSALTVLEALLGNLPAETYGTRGVSRLRPKRIYWFGAPKTDATSLQQCLRSRYKNGILQEMPSNTRPTTMLFPVAGKVKGFDSRFENSFSIGDKATVELVIDCTNMQINRPLLRPEWQVDQVVGPASPFPLPATTQQLINELGITENIISLWATMDVTDRAVNEIMAMAQTRR